MKLKVCGLKFKENIEEVVALVPDYLGFIFYPPSPRFVNNLDPSIVKEIKGPQKIGVFVNASLEEIIETVEKFGLDLVQLHGNETLEFIKEAKGRGLRVIKVFRIADQLPTDLDAYASSVEMFLFDTDTKTYGGSGKQFDWILLKEVSFPFLLSGGIGPDDLEKIKKLNLKHLIGIDVNSRVEEAPGRKSISQIIKLKEQL
jgi:phosphoribosylanthranilate isomerase